MSTAIVYYSATGNTRYIAERLSSELEATLVELKEEKLRRGFFGLFRGALRALSDRPPRLTGDPWSEIVGHNTVYLLTPIWAGHGAPQMSAFLQGADLRQKQVYIVTLQADPAGHGSYRVHENLGGRIEEKGGTVELTYALHSAPAGKFAGEEHLEEQLQRLL